MIVERSYSRLLKLLIKPTVLEENMTGKKRKGLNLYEKENLSNVEKKIDVGFVIEDEINNMKKKDFVTANQIKMFLKLVQGFLCTMVNKLFERSPLASVFLLSAAMRDPNIVLSNASK